MEETKKPIHAKPSYYGIMFEPLKEIAIKYGYNLVLHGSLNRDMDLIAIPWIEGVGYDEAMIDEICEFIGGEINLFSRLDENNNVVNERFTPKPHGRKAYVIDIFRGGYMSGSGFSDVTYFKDPQTYLDISVLPTI